MVSEAAKDNNKDILEVKAKVRLPKLRKELGLSQTALAKELGVAQNTISQWETGAREIDFKNIRRLCERFNVSADYLLGIPSKWNRGQYEEYAAADNKERVFLLSKWGCPEDKNISAPKISLPKEFEDDEELISLIETVGSRPELLKLYKTLMAKSAQNLSDMLEALNSKE